MTATWYDTKERILELVRYDVEHGDLHHPAHIRRSERRVDLKCDCNITNCTYCREWSTYVPTLTFVPAGWDGEDDIENYAREFADGCEWVIYTHQARTLWADSVAVQDYEDMVADYCDTHEDIDRRITLCVYEATYDAVLNAIETIREEMGK